ncbi:DgyrCDS14604 [Dimorphilus gyrociliatus]|uniref:DgyrCDS14604 n=1 Tax=Dimorphilus gyrociliatus TaxID=2664684 RepID=A0A7I8WEB9_9ANNE|nr:DgyrCDS14604 [Dimorphilus gyrociliatus]
MPSGLFFCFLILSCTNTFTSLKKCQLMSESVVSNDISEYTNRMYYSGGYSPDTIECERFTSPKSKPYFLVKVISTDMEMSSGCHDDFAAIYNGSDTSGNLIKKWCGTMQNFSFEVIGSPNIFFYFSSDSDENVGKGTKFEIIVPESRYQETETSSVNLSIVLGGSARGLASVIAFVCMIWCLYRCICR